MSYQDFLGSKRLRVLPKGKQIDPDAVNPVLFPFQRDIVLWACRKGRCLIATETGTGKTIDQLEWAKLMRERTLILAPLSVASQTVDIGRDVLGYDVEYVRDQSQVNGHTKIFISNYEMFDHFDMSQFGAIVLDEASILKSMAGKTRRKLIDGCQDVPYRLCCSATPAPNDHTELGGQAEFLGICTTNEMLGEWFINANKDKAFEHNGQIYVKKGPNKGGQEWRLKRHAPEDFFRWLSSWAMCLVRPSDLGYSDEGFDLPPLHIHTHFVESGYVPEGQLAFTRSAGIRNAAEIRQFTLPMRLEKLKEIVDDEHQWIIWCGLNAESTAATEAFPDAVEVKGADSIEHKINTFRAFQRGDVRILVSKPTIAGMGMNFQNSWHHVFFGKNHSWELWKQARDRQYRFRQEHEVHSHVILSDVEASIWENIKRKDALNAKLREEMISRMRIYEQEELGMDAEQAQETYNVATMKGEGWTAMLGDSCERLQEFPDNSIHLSGYSPPFATDLYVYSATDRDLANAHDWDTFFEHYRFIIRELLRVTMPGRLTCVHCADIPAMVRSDGFVGLKDLPGEIIRAYQEEGWIWHGRTTIDKNAQTQANRNNVKGLAFGQLAKDSSHMRSAIADYSLVFRKPGENPIPITPVENGDMDNETWIRWARPIWFASDYKCYKDVKVFDDFGNWTGEWRVNTDFNPDGIREQHTLQGVYESRDKDDDKHVCPLQLDVYDRWIKLYSNPGETFVDVFGGIGSGVVTAMRNGRIGIGIELKESYWRVMVKNCKKEEAEQSTSDMFDLMGVDVPDGQKTTLELT
jgi:DNA modification methylase